MCRFPRGHGDRNWFFLKNGSINHSLVPKRNSIFSFYRKSSRKHRFFVASLLTIVLFHFWRLIEMLAENLSPTTQISFQTKAPLNKTRLLEIRIRRAELYEITYQSNYTSNFSTHPRLENGNPLTTSDSKYTW